MLKDEIKQICSHLRGVNTSEHCTSFWAVSALQGFLDPTLTFPVAVEEQARHVVHPAKTIETNPVVEKDERTQKQSAIQQVSAD